jgi:hypothetical protein
VWHPRKESAHACSRRSELLLPTTFTGQGGHDGGCSIPGFDVNSKAQVQAVVFNFVAVGSSGPGDIVGWPTDQPEPSASILNYANSASLGFLNLANGLVVPVRQNVQGADITLKAQVSDTDVLADVVGYFSNVSAVQGSATENLFLGAGAGNQAVSTGAHNTAIGALSLAHNTTGLGNAAFGWSAMTANTTGAGNAALGDNSLAANASGNFNTSLGADSLLVSTTGGSNTALGTAALGSNTTGSSNLAIGAAASTHIATGSNNIDIAASPSADESGTIRIGTAGTHIATFIAGIDGATSASGTAVFVNASGQLGTATSSLRFKEDVEDMGEASAALMRLRPVTFHYKPGQDDGSRLLQYGLVAEEVARVYPGLVQYDAEGQPQTVRYHFVDAMLLNETQRLHRRVEELQARLSSVAQLAAEVERQQAQLREQRAQIEELRRLVQLSLERRRSPGGN